MSASLCDCTHCRQTGVEMDLRMYKHAHGSFRHPRADTMPDSEEEIICDDYEMPPAPTPPEPKKRNRKTPRVQRKSKSPKGAMTPTPPPPAMDDGCDIIEEEEEAEPSADIPKEEEAEEEEIIGDDWELPPSGDNTFDASGVTSTVIPVGGSIAQITQSEAAAPAEQGIASNNKFMHFVPSGADTSARLMPDSCDPPTADTAAEKHNTITRREVQDLERRKVVIRTEAIKAGGDINQTTCDPYFRNQLTLMKNSSNSIFKNAATMLEQVLFTEQGAGEGAHIEVDRAADCQLFLSNDSHVELMLKCLKQITKAPFNWLSTPHDVTALNSYAITRDRKTLLSLARTPGNKEPVAVCPNNKQCASRFLDPPFPKQKLPIADLDLMRRFGENTHAPCVFCQSYYNSTVTTLLESLGSPMPQWCIISRIQHLIEGPYGFSKELVRFPRIPTGNIGGIVILPRRGHCFTTDESGSVSWSHTALAPRTANFQ